MTTIYQRLSPLGFAEWLNKKLDAKIYFNKWMTEKDKLPLDSIGRTELNALAFRWLREDKNLDITVKAVYPFDYNDGYPNKVYVAFFTRENDDVYVDEENGLAFNHFESHPLAEHAALNKALEIINKGGENENN